MRRCCRAIRRSRYVRPLAAGTWPESAHPERFDCADDRQQFGSVDARDRPGAESRKYVGFKAVDDIACVNLGPSTALSLKPFVCDDFERTSGSQLRSTLVGFLCFAWGDTCSKLFARYRDKRYLRVRAESQALFFAVDAVLKPIAAVGWCYQ